MLFTSVQMLDRLGGWVDTCCLLLCRCLIGWVGGLTHVVYLCAIKVLKNISK